MSFKQKLLPYCRCFGDLQIKLYDGPDLITELRLHHGNCIRWKDGPFDEQAKMTDQSREHLEAWIANHIDE